jgi:nicotinamidase-related amidase
LAERVWEKFLTERDKAHLRIRESRPKRTVFGSKPAVLNIDNYRSVAGDAPMDVLEMIKVWPGSMGYSAWDALENIADLLKTAREAGMPIAHVHGRLPPSESGVWSWGSGGRRKASEMTEEELDRQKRGNDFMPQAAPLPGEIVLKKTAPSAFFGTPLMAGLNALDVDTLIITGESTSGCVRASVLDAKAYRFNVVIAEECVYDRHEACHAINLFDMDQKYATVLPLAEIKEWIAAWSKTKAETPMIPAV